jgi:TnpA family transposase
MEKATKRLKILSNAEIKELYNKPKFNPEQRAFYFFLNELQKQEIESLRSLESRIYFILQLGYFRSKLLFFNINFRELGEDIHYILCEYFPNEKFPKKMISPRTQLESKSRILRILGFRLFSQEAKQILENQALQSIKISANPRYVFDNLLNCLLHNSVSIPGYSTLQEIITYAFSQENNRIISIIAKHIPQYVDNELKPLLKAEEQTYGITLLKKDAKGFNHTELMREIEKKNTCRNLFKFAKKIIPKLKISEQNIRYYASLVDYYTVDRLNALSFETVRLYLLCYVFYRFQKINDNLVNSFMYHLNDYKKKADEASKESIYHQKIESNSYDEKARQLLSLYVDETLSDGIFFGDVRTKAFAITPKEQFPMLMHHLKRPKYDETQFKWNHYLKMSRGFCKNLRPLVRAIDFEGEEPNNSVMKALTFIKGTFDKGKLLTKLKAVDFPKEFIPNQLDPYLYTIKLLKKEGKEDEKITKFSSQKYEFLAYSKLENHLDSGKIVVNDSINFKSFKKDLLSDSRWKNKEDILKKLNNPVLNTPIKVQLADFQQILDPLIREVNRRIQSVENKEIKIKDNGEWTLPYQAQDKEANNPFYAQLSQVGLSDVMRFVNQNCDFMKAFTHIKPHYSKSQADEDAILACITANATNHGIYSLSEISDISYSKLLSTQKNFIRLETLEKANTILANGIAELPMFKRWNLMDNRLFSSLDGKKVRTRYKIIMARYSSKYFGQETGVVSYSMISNHVCVNTQVIGPENHESHYLFDAVSNNQTNIQPEWHSGDTHNINRVNFVLLHLISRKFTPHIKDISDKAATIYFFADSGEFKDCLIVPKGKINTALIEEEWDNIQRIFASLLLKETTQSVIVRKLSSYDRHHKTLRALHEFDKILMSIYVLQFIDNPILRQCVRTALNRGESYHQLTGKISSVNGNKFRGTMELELQIANQCSRFVSNCITYYNTIILSKIYETQEKLGNTKALEFIKRLSPVAWRHINLSGRYEFSKVIDTINIDDMIANLDFEMKKNETRA